VIRKDIPRVSNLRFDDIERIEKTLEFIGKSEVDGINFSSISKNLGITKYKAEPFVIMFTVPLASIGVILAILVLRMNVTIPVFIGGVLLIGIVVNNGIVMIDYINKLRKKEHTLREAILIGAKRRLRPIMMTTLTTSLALVPMALGFGEGSEINAPLAHVVIGGMLVSALFTILFVPTLYGSINGIGK